MREVLRQAWGAALLAVLMAVPACNKKQEAAQALAAVESKTVATPTLAERAAKLGFAAHLPADTEAYFGTLNLPLHTAALRETNYFKDITTFLDDKMPAPASASSEAKKDGVKSKPFEKLMGNDFFISLGKGAAKAITGWQKLSAFQTELMYRGLMAGATPGSNPDGKPEKAQMLTTVLKDPELLQRVADSLADLQLPPVMIGVRTDKPEEMLKELLPDDMLTQVRQKARVSQVTTSLNGKFTLIEGTGKDVFTDDMKKQFIASLPPEAMVSMPVIEKALASLQAKPFTFAYGTAGDYLIVAAGSTRPNLQFLDDANAATSLVSRPEFGLLTPYQAMNLTGLLFAQADTLQSLQNPEPLQPIARGVLAGLRQSPIFAGMAQKLEPKVAALAPLEHNLHIRPMTTAIGVAWWDKGLHLELDGGVSPQGIETGKALKFASLINQPNVVLGVDYHGDPQLTGAVRTYVEGWAEVLHQAGLELAQAGMFGEQGPKMASWADLEVIPQLVAFYTGTKTLYGKALGNEHAWLFDLGGKMPALPGMAPPTPQDDTPMLRLAALDDVVDRQLVSDSWDQMNASLNGLTKAFPMLGGQKLPDPEVSSKGGVTSYTFPLPTGSDDLLPCVSLNDKLFMLGTSKNQQEQIASRLLRAPPDTDTSYLLLRLSFPQLRATLKNFAPAAPAVPAADNVRAAIKWMAPLGDLRLRTWIEAGHVRNSITWDMKDVTKFD